jgi:hypothetical protein
MSFRNLIATGLLNALLWAGFSGNALGVSFTNGDFTTYEQADWGDTADGTNAVALLQANYDTVYASTSGSFEVGVSGPSGFSMIFTGSSSLLSYLPDGGSTGPLPGDLLNPTSTASGAFGGDVTALKLNIDFSDAGLLPGNLGIHFGDLKLQNFHTLGGKNVSSLNVLTVRQFAGGMNNLLGGGTFFIPTRNFTYHTADIDLLDPVIAELNASFDEGVIVSTFATNNLTIAPVPLVIQTVSRSGNSVTLTWGTTPTEMYQVQSSTNLSQTNWISLGSPIRATNLTMTASATSTNSKAFYRIAQLP